MFKSRKLFEYGGIAASLLLIAFGIGAIALSINGRNTVHSNLRAEVVMGTSDMTPSAIKTEAKQAKLPASVSLPTCNVAGHLIDTGSEARCFAQYMRIHSLELTGGYTYSQLGRYEAAANTPKSAIAPGGGTNDAQYAKVDPKTGQPVSDSARDTWVTAIALMNALNASYMAEQVALFGLVVGVALLLSGIGFGVLLAIGGVLRSRPESAEAPGRVPVTAS
jgi:uncharacterized iron-regulated membrane protein